MDGILQLIEPSPFVRLDIVVRIIRLGLTQLLRPNPEEVIEEGVSFYAESVWRVRGKEKAFVFLFFFAFIIYFFLLGTAKKQREKKNKEHKRRKGKDEEERKTTPNQGIQHGWNSLPRGRGEGRD